jgi:hypothetical protein
VNESEKTAPKPKRETWLDWVAPVPTDEAMARAEPLLTTDQLLAALESQGIKITRWDLSYWQRQGVIPYPTKGSRGGATWALYPRWMIDVVQVLRRSQTHGQSLDLIAMALRRDVKNVFGKPLEGDAQSRLEEQIANMQYRAELEKAIPHLKSAAAAFERMTGKHVRGFDIHVRTQPRENGWLPDRESLTVDIFNPNEANEEVYWRLKDWSK